MKKMSTLLMVLTTLLAFSCQEAAQDDALIPGKISLSAKYDEHNPGGEQDSSGSGSGSGFASFGGLNVAPSPLCFDGDAYVIKNDGWSYDGYGSIYGKSAGSYYHSFIDLGRFFDSEGASFSKSSGDIDNNGSKVSFGGYDDWRMPTLAEWYTLTTGEAPGALRAGSTVNGVDGARYALVQLTGVVHASKVTPDGLLLFPDGLVITGKALNGVNDTVQTTGVSLSELQAYLDQGCVFLAASGYYYAPIWIGGGGLGRYWSATGYADSALAAHHLDFTGWRIRTDVTGKGDYNPAYLVRTISE